MPSDLGFGVDVGLRLRAIGLCSASLSMDRCLSLRGFVPGLKGTISPQP